MTFIVYINIIIGAVLLWLSILTILTLRARRHYYQLSTRTKSGSIDTILEQLLNNLDIADKSIKELKKDLQEKKEEDQSHLHKIGFLRFNAFDRTGGEQSFVVSLLDSLENGIVLTFLHTREGVRVLAKRVSQGKADEYELSAEEKEAVKNAV